jgi:hypothetical protein
MFCWLCIIVYQYNETNVIHFSFSLLIIKSLYMFRALLARPQVALHKRHLVYCVRVMSVGCDTVAISLQPCYSQLTLYARSIQSAVCWAPSEDAQVMLETCRGSWLSINWVKSASRWFHYTDISLRIATVHAVASRIRCVCKALEHTVNRRLFIRILENRIFSYA